MDVSFSFQTPHLQSSAARLNHLLFEVMTIAMPPVAYSFVTKSCPALHTFARAGRRAGTRGETKSQMPHGSCVHEPAGIAGERFGHPVLLSYLRTSHGLEPLPVPPYGVSPVLMRPCRSSAGREGFTNRAYGLERFSLECTVSINHHQASTEGDWYEPVHWYANRSNSFLL